MTALEFVASLVKSLAWPLVVCFVVFIMRRSIGELMRRLLKLKYGELEADFSEGLSKIEIDQSRPRAQVLEPHKRDVISFSELAEASPRAAVLEAWIAIESALRKYLVSRGLDPQISYQGLRRLSNDDLRPIEAVLSDYQELRLLRNKAAHAAEFDLSSELARRYVNAAALVESAFLEAAKGDT